MTDEREPVRRGEVVDASGSRVWTWDWSDDAVRRGPPWIGIFLVVLGALLLLERFVPGFEMAGSVAVLAVGLAFLVSWAINRRTASLYIGAIVTALAAPELIAGAGIAAGPGLGQVCLGLAFLFIAAVRVAGGGGIGWQAWLGIILVILGGSRAALPSLDALVWPIVLVALGGLLLFRGNSRA